MSKLSAEKYFRLLRIPPSVRPYYCTVEEMDEFLEKKKKTNMTEERFYEIRNMSSLESIVLNPVELKEWELINSSNKPLPWTPVKKEAINHPDHYGGGTNPYEAIKVIEAWSLDFCLGNAIKYISRAGKKDATKELEDLEKAKWYLQRRIDNLKK